MINKGRVPEKTYQELVEFLGPEDAQKFIEQKQYNFHTISLKILSENLKKRYGKHFWIYFWIIVALIFVLYWLDLVFLIF